MNNSTKILLALAAGWLTATVSTQDRIHYTGTEISNPTYHDGQLSPVVGVHNINWCGQTGNTTMPLTAMVGLTIINRCWRIGTVNSIINTWLILRTNTSRLPKPS